MTTSPAPSAVALDVLLFASAAEAFGASSVRLELPAPATAGAVRRALLQRARAAGASLPSSCRVAVNQAFVGEDQPVRAGDEVALIPPVAGG